MIFPLVPQYALHEFSVVSPVFLKMLGVKFLMLDLDNTIAMYNECLPTDLACQWVAEMKNNNIELFFVSNSKRKSRVEAFAEALGIGYISRARKPSPNSLLSVMESLGFRPDEAALLGDQIFTDTLAANRAGVISIIVHPLSMKNPLHSLRFAIEAPFRAACKCKNANAPCGAQGVRRRRIRE